MTRTYVDVKAIGINRPASRTPLPWLKIPQPLKNGGTIGAVKIYRLARNKIESRVIELPSWLEESHSRSRSPERPFAR